MDDHKQPSAYSAMFQFLTLLDRENNAPAGNVTLSAGSTRLTTDALGLDPPFESLNECISDPILKAAMQGNDACVVTVGTEADPAHAAVDIFKNHEKGLFMSFADDLFSGLHAVRRRTEGGGVRVAWDVAVSAAEVPAAKEGSPPPALVDLIFPDQPPPAELVCGDIPATGPRVANGDDAERDVVIGVAQIPVRDTKEIVDCVRFAMQHRTEGSTALVHIAIKHVVLSGLERTEESWHINFVDARGLGAEGTAAAIVGSGGEDSRLVTRVLHLTNAAAVLAPVTSAEGEAAYSKSIAVLAMLQRKLDAHLSEKTLFRRGDNARPVTPATAASSAAAPLDDTVAASAAAHAAATDVLARAAAAPPLASSVNGVAAATAAVEQQAPVNEGLPSAVTRVMAAAPAAAPSSPASSTPATSPPATSPPATSPPATPPPATATPATSAPFAMAAPAVAVPPVVGGSGGYVCDLVDHLANVAAHLRTTVAHTQGERAHVESGLRRQVEALSAENVALRQEVQSLRELVARYEAGAR